MNRRHFLKLLGLSGAAAVAGVATRFLPSVAERSTKQIGFKIMLGRSFVADAPEGLWEYLERAADTSAEQHPELRGLHPLGPWQWTLERKARTLKHNHGEYLWQPGLRYNDPDLFIGRPVEFDLASRPHGRAGELFTFAAIQDWGV